MVKKWNERITITLPKNQAKWLKKTAKTSHKTVSVLIKEILSSRIFEIEQINSLKMMSDEDLAETIRIAKTPWLDE